MKNKKFFTELALITVTATLVSNIIAVKQFTFWNLSLTSGMLVFPIIYIISDVVSEVYGYKASRKVAWYGFFANLFMVLMFQLAIMLPYPEYFGNQEAFKTILGNTPRIFIVGQIAYIVGDWTNDLTFRIMKEKGGNSFKLRAIFSSMVGEFFDSGLFIPLAFYGTMPNNVLIQMIFLQWVTKILYEILILPITQMTVNFIKKKEGIYEH